MRELQKLSTTRNNDTNEDKDVSYDFKYFLLCYWVISFNFWRIYRFSFSDFHALHFNFDSPAAVSLHFFTHSKNQLRRQTVLATPAKFRLRNLPQNKSEPDSVSGHWNEKYLVKTRKSILVSIHRTTKFAIFCFEIWNNS